MTATESKTELYENLRRAAGFDANSTYPALFQHLGYRKRITEDLLREGDPEKIKYLTELYYRINQEIKLIIGL